MTFFQSTSHLQYILIFIFFLSGFFQCQNRNPNHNTQKTLTEGIKESKSDTFAIRLADATMKAMGGKKKWDSTRYFSWNFFGRRDLIWDKYTGNVRIESPYDSTIYLVNINNLTGKVRIKGKEINNQDSLKELLTQAKNIWINDSYWLFMPFKLKDDGVTLKYKGEKKTANGDEAYVLSLTFDTVGVTPENRYEVFITKNDSLVKQWIYYKNSSDKKPVAIWPWDNYKSFDGLMLSSDRSDAKGPNNVQIYHSLDDRVFNDLDWKN